MANTTKKGGKPVAPESVGLPDELVDVALQEASDQPGDAAGSPSETVQDAGEAGGPEETASPPAEPLQPEDAVATITVPDAEVAGAEQASPSEADAPLQPEVATSPNPSTVQIFPLRSYMDEGELRRRGGAAYTVPRRHADELIDRGLATREKPEG